MNRIIRFSLLAFILSLYNVPIIQASTGIRIKDIVHFGGVRENQLVGYGLVVGLNNTGDSLTNAPFTNESLISMMERLGVNVRNKTITGQNVAAVMVTADLPAFARHGSRIDVTVSSVGSAKDLRGGTLLVTPLMGADGAIYAVAQGAVANGGFATAPTKAGTSVTKGVPTSGRIANGALIEKETGYELAGQSSIKLALRNPDFTTAVKIAEVINKHTGTISAIAMDPSTVNLTVCGDVTKFMSRIEQLNVSPDQVARVVIDEQNGVIVMGDSVRISPVAISHGNLTIKISENTQVSQPNPFSHTGTTEKVARSDIAIDDDKDKKIAVLKPGVSLQELVNSLNSMGIGPQDMITILRTIKRAGALQADVELM